jgi:hypothetical protein
MYDKIYDIKKSLDMLGFNLNNQYTCLLYVLLHGLIYRILALIALICSKPNSYFQLSLFRIRGFFSILQQKINDWWSYKNLFQKKVIKKVLWFEREEYSSLINEIIEYLEKKFKNNILINTIKDKNSLIFNIENYNLKFVLVGEIVQNIDFFILGEHDESDYDSDIEKIKNLLSKYKDVSPPEFRFSQIFDKTSINLNNNNFENSYNVNTNVISLYEFKNDDDANNNDKTYDDDDEENTPLILDKN